MTISKLKAGEQTTLTTQEWQALSVSGSADAKGVVYWLDDALGGGNSHQSWQVGAGALPVIGPYAGVSRFLLTCTVGAISATIASAELSAAAGSTTAPFSAVISLIGNTSMAKQVVSGPIAFTPAAGAIAGSSCLVVLIADGINLPTFTGGFGAGDSEWCSSFGYVNTAGYLNIIQFWYDGVGYRYSISQPANQVLSDTVAPTATAAAVANAFPAIVALTMSEALDAANVPAALAFTVDGHTVSGVSISGAVVNVAVTPAFVNGEAARTLAYIQPATAGLRDANGNLTASFSARAITNNVAATDTTAPVLQSIAINGANAVMTYNEALGTAAPTLSSLSFAFGGGVAVNPTSAVVSGATVNLAFAAAATAGQSVTAAYSVGASPIRDSAGNNAAAFSGQSVTNNTAASTAARLTSLLRMTEAGSAAPYTYTGTSGEFTGTTNADGEGRLAVAFQNGIDGAVVIQTLTTPVASTGPETLLSVDASNASGQSYALMDYAMVNHPSGYNTFTNGAQGTASSILGAANDYQRVSRVGSSLIFDVSKDGGNTWATVRTFTGVPTGVLYVFVRTAFAAQFVLLAATGMA